MKKRVLFHTHMLESDALKNYLDEQLKQGWVLTKVGREILTFEQCEHPDFQYAIGIFQSNTNENNEYRNVAEQFGYEYVGDRDGIIIFKTTSNVPFYSDELVDEEYKNSKIRKSMFWRIVNSIFLFVIIFQSYFLTLSHKDFISDIEIYMCIIFFIYTIFSLFGNNYGVIPYLKYRHSHKVRSDYKGIEWRSWSYNIFSFVMAIHFLMFLMSGFKYENVSLIPYLLGSWIGIAAIGAILYHFRAHWLRAIEIGFVSIALFVVSFMLIVGNQHKPLVTTVDRMEGILQGSKITYYVDSYDIPLSLCNHEACELIENDIQESVVMRRQSVNETLEDERYSYIYYEITSSLFEDKMIRNIFEYWDWFVEINQTFGEYVYGYQPFEGKKLVDLIVRKNNEVYVFITLDCENNEEAIQTFIQNLPWKS